MTALQPLPIAPGNVWDISWNFAGWLPDGDAIQTVAPDGPTVSVPTGVTLGDVTVEGKRVYAWVTIAADAKIGVKYECVCKIKTVQGRVDSRVYQLIVAKK